MAIVRKEDCQITPVPRPGQIFALGMSKASAAPEAASTPTPTTTPVPRRPGGTSQGGATAAEDSGSEHKSSGATPSSPTSSSSSSSSISPPAAAGDIDNGGGGGGQDELRAFPQPKLRLEVRDVLHRGAHRFLSLVDASELLPRAVADVQRVLYGRPGDRTTHAPPTRSVTVILRDMDGVAYTTGSDLDSDHKEIHFSLGYIAQYNNSRNKSSGGGGDRTVADEIAGVLTHELVHCYQWDAKGTCPGGLIEGVADFVRLQCGLSPPHWRKEVDGGWDRGYQHTAYFLAYLEHRYGDGTVRRINESLRVAEYREKHFWTDLLGRPVEQLWDDYVKHSKKEKEEAEEQAGMKTTVDEGTQT